MDMWEGTGGGQGYGGRRALLAQIYPLLCSVRCLSLLLHLLLPPLSPPTPLISLPQSLLEHHPPPIYPFLVSKLGSDLSLPKHLHFLSFSPESAP